MTQLNLKYTITYEKKGRVYYGLAFNNLLQQ